MEDEQEKIQALFNKLPLDHQEGLISKLKAIVGEAKHGRAKELLDELRRLKGRSVGAKYMCKDTGKLWAGRGRVPKWIADHEAAGGSREDFKV